MKLFPIKSLSFILLLVLYFPLKAQEPVLVQAMKQIEAFETRVSALLGFGGANGLEATDTRSLSDLFLTEEVTIGWEWRKNGGLQAFTHPAKGLAVALRAKASGQRIFSDHAIVFRTLEVFQLKGFQDLDGISYLAIGNLWKFQADNSGKVNLTGYERPEEVAVKVSAAERARLLIQSSEVFLGKADMIISLTSSLGTSDNSGGSQANNQRLPNQEKTHFVQKGETLYGLARKYGLEIETLKRINGLTDNLIQPGQRLMVQGGIASKMEEPPINNAESTRDIEKRKQQSAQKLYQVEEGDNLFTIADKHGLSIVDLVDMNPNSSFDVGDKVVVKK